MTEYIKYVIREHPDRFGMPFFLKDKNNTIFASTFNHTAK